MHENHLSAAAGLDALSTRTGGNPSLGTTTPGPSAVTPVVTSVTNTHPPPSLPDPRYGEQSASSFDESGPHPINFGEYHRQ